MATTRIRLRVHLSHESLPPWKPHHDWPDHQAYFIALDVSAADVRTEADVWADEVRPFLDRAERDFWAALEFRICAEFDGFEDRLLRHYWCDGLIPDDYDLQADEPCIRGLAYCGQTGQEQWRFTLLIGSSVSSPKEIDWTSLLPPDDMTGWLTPHPHERTLILDPLSAYAD